MAASNPANSETVIYYIIYTLLYKNNAGYIEFVLLFQYQSISQDMHSPCSMVSQQSTHEQASIKL